MVVDTGTPEVKVFEYSVGGAFGELALLHGEPRQVSSSLSISSLALSDTTDLKYKPSSEPLHISAKKLFLDGELNRSVQLS